MKRSRTTILDDTRRLYSKAAPSSRACSESGFIHPAAMASSGFRSIFQNSNRPPRSRTKNAAITESSGGGGTTTTTSCLGISISSEKLERKKEAALITRRIFDFFPKPHTGTRRILTPFHVSSRGNSFAGLSYPRLLHRTVTSWPAALRLTPRSVRYCATATTSG